VVLNIVDHKEEEQSLRLLLQKLAAEKVVNLSLELEAPAASTLLE
jgi:hypothetical protein